MLPVKFTIIIPAFNEAAYLGATLDSIEDAATHLRADCDAETDVIVVDNNSRDETAAIARSKGRRWSTSRCRASRGPETPGRAMRRGTCLCSSTRT